MSDSILAPPAQSVPAAGRRPVAVDLFAGAGGLSLGLEQAGFDIAAAVEYDPVHAAAHKFNFPHTAVLCSDVSGLRANALRVAIRRGLAAHGRDLDAWDGQVDLLAGGPPCQGFSLIGKRLVDDLRNRLVFFTSCVLCSPCGPVTSRWRTSPVWSQAATRASSTR